MPHQIALSDPVTDRQNVDQLFYGLHLRLRRWSLLEIPDQANTNSTSIKHWIPGMSPVKLLIPAKGGLNRPILHSLAIADHKVITNTQPRISRSILSLAMLFMNPLHTSRFAG